jgi:hypothetical protein
METGRAARPYRWLIIELLTHEAWNVEASRSARRRFQQGLDRREAELYGLPPVEGAKAAAILPFKRNPK